MDEITQQVIKNIDLAGEDDNHTIVITLGNGNTYGFTALDFVRALLSKRVVTLVEPSTDADPFILFEGKPFEVWRY